MDIYGKNHEIDALSMLGISIPIIDMEEKIKQDKKEWAMAHSSKNKDKKSLLKGKSRRGEAQRRSWRYDSLNEAKAGRKRDKSRKYAHERHMLRLAYGRGMWNGVNADDIRYRRNVEAEREDIRSTLFRDGQWWNIYMGEYAYHGIIVPFFGTRKEAEKRRHDMCVLRGKKGRISWIYPIYSEMDDEIETDLIDWLGEDAENYIEIMHLPTIGKMFGFEEVVTFKVTKK